MFLSLFLFFMTLTSWRSRSQFVRYSSVWVPCFLMIRLSYVFFFAKKYHISDTVPFSVHQMYIFYEALSKTSIKMILILSLSPESLKSVERGEGPRKKLGWVKAPKTRNMFSEVSLLQRAVCGEEPAGVVVGWGIPHAREWARGCAATDGWPEGVSVRVE